MRIFGYEIIIRKYQEVAPPKEVPTPKPAVKKEPQKKRPKKCGVMDKVNYTREEAALAEERIKNPYVRKYKCEFCEWWHMTHKRLKNG